MKKNNSDEKDFKAVEYMREVREKMTELYLEDKEKYKAKVRESFAEYKSGRNSKK